jgi:hypothetical protein
MPTNNGTVTLGWDSIESGVDEFELQERHFDLVDQMARPAPDVFEQLDDITNLIARARRDKNALLRVIDVYGLEIDCFKALDAIAGQTVKTVRHIAKA